jgi:hypothetical protein
VIKKKLLLALFCLVLGISSLSSFGVAHADTFNPDDIADDATFNNSTSMSAAQINQFLNQFPSSCISTNHGFSAEDPTGYNPTQGFLYGGLVSGGQVIYDAAQAYDLNPEVILATLQKEQSLVTGGGGCSTLAYTAAAGYGCPDSGGQYSYSGVSLYAINGSVISTVSGTCVNTSLKAGFSQQVIRAAWLLKFGEERSEGNINWAIIQGSWQNTDDLQSCYSGPMTQGTWQICPNQPATYYSGVTTIDGTAVQMENGATAALYWYTPHFSGNRNFFSIYDGWFGDPVSSCSSVGNLSGVRSGPQIISYKPTAGQATDYSLILQNNTGSGCVENHLLNGPAGQSWISHTATAMRATNPDDGQLLAIKPADNDADTMLYISYGGGGNNVSVHEFSYDLKTFPGYYDASTNLGGGFTASEGMFVTGDFLGRGYNQVALILYDGSSGDVEVHLFNRSMTQVIGYYDVATNLPGITPSEGTFVAGDFLGRGYDQLAFILYNGSGGDVGVHLFNPTLQKAVGYYDVQTNLPAVTATEGTFIAGDFLGRGYDQLAYVLYNGGSSGDVEVHLFNQSLTKAIGYYDSPTIISPIDPTQ